MDSGGARSPADAGELDRARLERAPRRLLHRGRSRNPDVFLVDLEGRRVVIKDFAARAGWVRRWLAPWLVRRELRAYRRLEGHPWVPRLIGPVDALAFALEYRPGRRLSRRLVGELPPDFLAELERAVAEVHARGVVHLDLRHRSNVLLGADGHPVLIDFASAVCLRPDGWAARWILPLLAWVDRRAVHKWCRKLGAQAPDSAGEGGGCGLERGASRPT